MYRREAVVKIAAPLMNDPKVHGTRRSVESADGRAAQMRRGNKYSDGGFPPSLLPLDYMCGAASVKDALGHETRVLDKAGSAQKAYSVKKSEGGNKQTKEACICR